MLVTLVWCHYTAERFQVKTGYANPDSDSRTEWTVSLNPMQIQIWQIEYAIGFPGCGGLCKRFHFLWLSEQHQRRWRMQCFWQTGHAAETVLTNVDFTGRNWWRRSSESNTHLTALCSGTTQVSRYQKGKSNLDSEWQWHQLGHMQVCTSLHTSTPPLSFLQAGCSSCRPTNSVKALKAKMEQRECRWI